ncbi:hypothetical protein JL09_g5705 [Pichia kudriavzevii]|uniref:Uncharacterized protein n=1 Tax=Pichia kudriavzevii TaxID=4909 RepID=A0A099NRF0_PICKU|nr:hypothetical protein JL09_g5705 [Pichia kudriavzevii]
MASYFTQEIRWKVNSLLS